MLDITGLGNVELEKKQITTCFNWVSWKLFLAIYSESTLVFYMFSLQDENMIALKLV